MKKIIAVTGSPRDKEQSKTYKAVLRFLGSFDQSKIEYEIISLKDFGIKPCTGCTVCQKTGTCVLNDGMAELEEKLTSADMIIFASPVHFSHVSAVFQNFVERSLVGLHTFKYIGKPFINIITTNGSGEEEADKYMTRIGLLFGCIKLGSVYEFMDGINDKQYRKIYKAVKGYIEGIEAKPTMTNRIYYSYMKKAVKGNKDCFEAEYNIWEAQEWFGKSYKKAVDNKIEPVKAP